MHSEHAEHSPIQENLAVMLCDPYCVHGMHSQGRRWQGLFPFLPRVTQVGKIHKSAVDFDDRRTARIQIPTNAFELTELEGGGRSFSGGAGAGDNAESHSAIRS